jgi:hypothetical protein
VYIFDVHYSRETLYFELAQISLQSLYLLMDNSLSTGLTKVTSQRLQNSLKSLTVHFGTSTTEIELGFQSSKSSRFWCCCHGFHNASSYQAARVICPPKEHEANLQCHYLHFTAPFVWSPPKDLLWIGDSMPVMSAVFSMKTPPSRLMCTWQFFLSMVDC